MTAGIGRQRPKQAVGQVQRLDRGDPDALHPRRGDRAHQPGEAVSVRATPTADVDAGEHDFARPFRDQPRDAGHDLLERLAARRSASVRHDAVRTPVVAAVLHLDGHPGAGPRVTGASQDVRGRRLDAVRLRAGDAGRQCGHALLDRFDHDGVAESLAARPRRPPPGNRSLSRRHRSAAAARRTALRAFASASPVTVHVFTITTSASATRPTTARPAVCSAASIASLSARFTLQPSVTTAARARRGSAGISAEPPECVDGQRARDDRGRLGA